jgi:hypothetical protein
VRLGRVAPWPVAGGSVKLFEVQKTKPAQKPTSITTSAETAGVCFWQFDMAFQK